MFGSEPLALRGSTSLENDRCALWRGMSGSVCNSLMVLAIEKDLVDLFRVVGTF
jgi:hypothetical protein